MADQTTSAADKLGANKNTSAIPDEDPSILSSAGAIGKQFNPDGAPGSIPQAVGGLFSKDGVIGSRFDAGKDGIAGYVERAVDGPRNPAGSGGKVHGEWNEVLGFEGVPVSRGVGLDREAM